MKKLRMFAAVVVVMLSNDCYAQQPGKIFFVGRMNTTLDVTITPINGGAPRTITLANGQPLPFNFTDSLVSMQVVPRDRPTTGFPAQQLDLADLSRRFGNTPIRLNGERGPSTTKSVYCRRGLFGRKCCCYTVTVEGERLAMLIEASSPNGDSFFLRVPVASY